jgi:mannose-6-phosphate isomerase-like protein (cupin superfamily)
MTNKPIVLGAGEGFAFSTPGESFVSKAIGDTTGGNLALVAAEWTPKHGTSAHLHPDSGEAFFILSGTFIIDIDKEEYHVETGAFAYVPPGATHRITNVGDEPGKFIAFFTPAGPEKGFRAVQKRAQELGKIPTEEEMRVIMAEHGTSGFGPPRTFDD